MSRNFDGVDDRVATADDAVSSMNSAGKTISLWMRPTDGTTATQIVCQQATISGAGGAGRINFTYKGSAATGNTNALRMLAAFSVTNGQWDTPTNSVPINMWINATVTYNYSSATDDPIWYFNGATQTLTEASTPTLTPSGGEDTFFAGANFNLLNEFIGQIAYIQVFNRILSQGEIVQIMRFPGSIRNGLLIFWPLWGTSSPEPDYSGNRNNGTVTGAIKGTTEPPINGIFQVPKPELITSF